VNNAIAVLDSGVGGLTVAKAVMRQLPQETIYYFGDTARAPYGPRPNQEIILYTRQVVEYLTRFSPKMIVIACNTATAVALNEIQAMVDIPVVGVIKPGARAAIHTSKTGKIGVIGTEGTIRSKAYVHALQERSPSAEVISLACPEFVPLVEAGNFNSEETWSIVRKTLAPLKAHQLDCLILGCTHYPFLAPLIEEVVGGSVQLINSAEETAREINSILTYRGSLVNENTDMPIHRFFCSGDPKLFGTIASEWLDKQVDITPIEWEVSKC